MRKPPSSTQLAAFYLLTHGGMSRTMLCNAALMDQISNFYSSFKQNFSRIFCSRFKLFENQTFRLSRAHCISIWNKEELLEEWKESFILLIYKKGDRTDCSNYRGISFLPTTYKILSNILPSSLTPYAEEVIGDHQCGFRRKRSTTDHIFSIRQIYEKKWE